MDFHLAVVAQIAIRMVAEAAEFHIADFSGRQAPALGVDNGEIVIGQRLADPAEAAPFAGDGGDPAHLAGAAALRDRDAEFLLEPLPLFEQQRRRARGDETQLRQSVAMSGLLAVKQDIDRRRIAGGNRDAVIAKVLEEPARREFFRQHQGGAAVDDSERAQSLRRVPAEGAEVIKPIVGGDAKTCSERIDVQQIFAEVQNDALGRGAGA